MTKYNYDLIVIGAGAAGLTASTGAAQLGAKTLLIEKSDKLGGDCLHYGCVPSKSLIKSAYCLNIMKNAARFGLPDVQVPKIDIQQVMKRVHQIIATIQEHDSPDYIKMLYNVDTLFGSPSFIDNHTIELNGEKITSNKFVIATGSSPSIPDINGLDHVRYLTNRNIFQLEELPESLLILGGGPIGMEMAQAFARLGSHVTVLQTRDQLLPKEDKDIAQFVKEKLESEGVTVHLNTSAQEVKTNPHALEVTALNSSTGNRFTLEAREILIATGRTPNIKGLNLKNAGVSFNQKGIIVDKRLRTSQKNIFACGDVNGGYQFTHVAGYEGGIAMVNAVMRLPIQADYSNVPWCTYMDPEIASIGLNEKRAQKARIEYTVHKEELKNNDRAVAESETDGYIKILRNEKGNVIGVQIIGAHAGDLIHEWVAVLNAKIQLSTIAQAIHAYPTFSEISKNASDNILAPKLFNDGVKKILKFLFHLQGS